MSRPASATDFSIDVEGVGNVIFARRTRRDGFRIAAEFHRLTEGVETLGTDFGLEAEAQATLSTLVVSASPEFEEMIRLDIPDPLDPEQSAKIVRVFLALRKKELSFRPGSDEEGKGQGKADGKQHGAVVSAKVQPAADGSEVS